MAYDDKEVTVVQIYVRTFGSLNERYNSTDRRPSRIIANSY